MSYVLCLAAVGGFIETPRIAPAAQLASLGGYALPCYTNLAGNAICGVPVSCTAQTVSLTNGAAKAVYRWTIFPESEKRRLAADAGTTQFIPAKIRLALAGVDKAVKRSQLRAEKGLCTKEQSRLFCQREKDRTKAYLDHEVAAGRLLPAERALLAGRETVAGK